jgi:hypothetical protein
VKKEKQICLTKKELNKIKLALKESAQAISQLSSGCCLVSVLDALEIVLAKK